MKCAYALIQDHPREGFWSLFERSGHGTFHHISKKHLHCHVGEFSGRRNIHGMDTIDMVTGLARGIVGKRLRHQILVV